MNKQSIAMVMPRASLSTSLKGLSDFPCVSFQRFHPICPEQARSGSLSSMWKQTQCILPCRAIESWERKAGELQEEIAAKEVDMKSASEVCFDHRQ